MTGEVSSGTRGSRQGVTGYGTHRIAPSPEATPATIYTPCPVAASIADLFGDSRDYGGRAKIDKADTWHPTRCAGGMSFVRVGDIQVVFDGRVARSAGQ